MTLEKALLRGILGIPIGVFIMTLIGLIISLSLDKLSLVSPMHLGHFSDLTVYSFQLLLSCLIGFAFAISSTYFQIERWSFAKQTFLHFLTISFVYFPSAIYLGWVELKPLSMIAFTAVFIGIYLTIWLIQYFALKKKIESLNSSLKEQ